MNHTKLDPEKQQFWKFSFDEIAYYDVPASIDYVLKETGHEKIYYVGFSMGSSTLLALLSDRPEYNDKLYVAALMGPAAYEGNMKGLLAKIAPHGGQIDTTLTLMGWGGVLKSTPAMKRLVNVYCKEDAPTAHICYDFYAYLSGPSEGELSKKYFPVIFSHFPAGTSLHNLNHFAQAYVTKKFQKYDYGRIGNKKHYGQPTPPEYDLSQATLPIGIFWAETDYLATPEDIEILVPQLPNVVLNHKVEKKLFGHLDFVWGINAHELAYKYVIDLLSQY